jgi:hypothetical protein
MPQLCVKADDSTLTIDRSAEPVVLIPGMIGRKQMFSTILDPFDRTAEAKSGKRNENVFWVKLSPYAESAADMTLEQMNLLGRQAEHHGKRSSIDMWDFGRAINLENTGIGIETRDCASRFHGGTGLTTNRNLDLDDPVRTNKGRFHVPRYLSDNGRFAREPGKKVAGFLGSVEQRRQFVDVGKHQVRRILRYLLRKRKHCSNRLAHIANVGPSKHRLAIGLKSWHDHLSEINRRHAGDVLVGPDRMDVGQ